MKKGLSILLVAAALFGFYGSAVNLNDVLACKDYWEKAGEESTANMNKLEDGLNQLKDNEQAYLDGKEQVADGEKALAEGEQTLAEGEATLAKGEADYAAAPGKLADARRQLAAGEQQIADGKEAINGLTKLIAGIKKLRGDEGYAKWKKSYDALAKGRHKLYAGTKEKIEDLTALAVFLPEGNRKAYVAAVKDVAADNEKQTAKDYKEFIKSTNNIAKNLPVIQKNVAEAYKNASNIYSLLKAQPTNFDFAKTVNTYKSQLASLAALIKVANGDAAAQTYLGIVNTVAKAYTDFDETVDTKYEEYLASDEGQQTEAYLISQNMDTGWATFFESPQGKAAIEQAKAGIAAAMGIPAEAVPDDTAKDYIKDNSAEANAAVKAGVKQNVDAGIKENVKSQVLAAYEDPSGALSQARAGLTVQYNKANDGGVIGSVVASLKDINDSVNGKDSAIKKELQPGLKEFNAQTAPNKEGKDASEQLADGQNAVADGVATIAGAVLGNKTLKAGVKKNFGNKAIKLLKKYKNANGPLSTSMSNFAVFEAQMDKKPGIDGFLYKAQKLLSKTKADGIKTLNKGKAKLADGYRQYNQGLADYAAAPAKLADGRQQLEEGRKALEEGRQTLADGKAQLAQYEDGEQQIRDGLATLAGTEADLDLESIKDRLKGDDDFDNGDEHLELDEGLAAVEVGRGYQAEDGVLITKEITARAVGTGALLGAGALAVLAAVLSFLKKNKGAGIAAILSAAAGAFGAFYGTNAGTYFSDIAGSTAGNTGWVAAGILGAIALVHAIVHFTAKKEA